MTIRLTLRTLLSYLDDTLEPAQAKIIGAKVAESDQARDLMERIKQVTRRRRLMTPTNSGPGGIDPNTIAEYLDNDVTPDQAAEVEQICLASDVHLAEVAACHQILTLVLGEPALVPPSAKQRMYGLTKGPEAIPTRKPSRAASKPENDLSSEIEADHDEALRLGVPALSGRGSQRNFYLLIGGGVLASCLLVVAVWQLTHSGNATKGADQVAQADDKGKDKDKDKTKSGKDADDVKQDAKKEKDEGKFPAPKPKQDDTKPSTGSEPQVVTVEPPAPAKVVFAPASDKQVVVGKHVQFAPKDLALLLQAGKSDKAGWARVLPIRGDGKGGGKDGIGDVVSGRPLLSFPGNKSVVILDSGIELTLWGNLYEITTDLFNMESRAVVHANGQLDADLTLQRGRLILRNLAAKEALVRIRFDNPTLNEENHFDITLYGKDAALLVERQCFDDEPFSENKDDKMRKGPVAIMNVYAYDKTSRISLGDVARVVDEVQVPFLRWNSREGTLIPPPNQTQLPVWFKGGPPMTKENDKQLRSKFIKAIDELTKALDKRAVDVALIEMISDAQEAFPREFATKKQISLDTECQWRYALRCLRGIDKVDKLFAVFADDTTPSFIRFECFTCLKTWLAQGRDNDYLLFDVLRKEYRKKQQAINIMELFHFIPADDLRKPITYQGLIEGLNNDLLPIRFLSAWHLNELAPAGRNIPYDAAMAAPDRQAAVRAWTKLIPPGQLPPTPKKV